MVLYGIIVPKNFWFFLLPCLMDVAYVATHPSCEEVVMFASVHNIQRCNHIISWCLNSKALVYVVNSIHTDLLQEILILEVIAYRCPV